MLVIMNSGADSIAGANYQGIELVSASNEASMREKILAPRARLVRVFLHGTIQ